MKKLLFLILITFFGCQRPVGEIRFIADSDNVSSLNNSVVALVQPTPAELSQMGIPNPILSRGLDTIGRRHVAYCAGFFISEDKILTAAHCVGRYKFFNTLLGPIRTEVDESPIGDMVKIVSYSQYKSDRGRMQIYRLYEVTKVNRAQDIAMLKLAGGQLPHIHHGVLSVGRNPSMGEIVYALGHPSGQGWSLTEGIISHPFRIITREQFGTQVHPRIIQASSQIFSGNSGGPLINNSGEAIGITSSRIQPHLAFFTHTRIIRSFLSEAN